MGSQLGAPPPQSLTVRSACPANLPNRSHLRSLPGVSLLGREFALKGFKGALQGFAKHPALAVGKPVEEVYGVLGGLDVELHIAARAPAAAKRRALRRLRPRRNTGGEVVGLGERPHLLRRFGWPCGPRLLGLEAGQIEVLIRPFIENVGAIGHVTPPPRAAPVPLLRPCESARSPLRQRRGH